MVLRLPTVQSQRQRAALLFGSGYLLVMLACFLAIRLCDLLPILAPYEQVLLAFIFLYSPLLPWAFFGRVHALVPVPAPGALRRSVGWALLLALLVLPLYAIGVHLYQTAVEGSAIAPAPARLLDWSPSWEGRPTDLKSGTTARVWTDGEGLYVGAPDGAPPTSVSWKQQEPFRPARLLHRNGSQTRVTGSGLLLSPGECLILDRLGVSELSIAGASIAAGPSGEPEPGNGRRPGINWLLWLVLAQILLVAFPEEYFYREILQQRLKDLLPAGPRFMWVTFIPAIALASLLFALGHLLSIPAPFRLLVFFPSLLFGWLREKGGHLAGPVIFHALCNVFQVLFARFYV